MGEAKITRRGGKGGIDVSDATAVQADVLQDKTFYAGDETKKTGTMTNRGAVSQTLAINGTYTIPAGFHNGSGTVSQSVATKGAQTFTPGTTNQTIAANQWLTGTQTIQGSANLIPNNIRQGTNIFGVVGTLVPVTTLTATGGTITTYSSGGKNYRVHTFTSSGNFVVSLGSSNVIKDGQVEYLVVSGGGGSGGPTGDGWAAGGGGAGGMLTGTSSLSAQTYSITVGSGGSAGVAVTGNNGANTTQGSDGNPSSFGSIISTVGGGGGGASSGASGGQGIKTSGRNGGSGGGGGVNFGSSQPQAGQGTSGQGNNGGTGVADGRGWSGSGGGRGGAGVTTERATGGAGLANNFRTGSNVTYATGGSTRQLSGDQNGPVNTGNGGGNRDYPLNGPIVQPGNGGSGIVVIRYEVA